MMTIYRKLSRRFLLISLLTCVIGGVAIWAVQKITREFREVSEEILPTIQLLEKVRFAGLRVVSSTSEYVFLLNERQRLAAIHPGENDEEQLIAAGRELFSAAMGEFRRLSATDHAHEDGWLAELSQQFDRLEQTSAAILAAKQRGVAGAAVLALKERFEAEEMTYLALVDQVVTHKYRELEAGKEKVNAKARGAVKGIISVTLLLFAAALFFSFRMSRSIAGPLEQLCRASNEIGTGRLHTRISTAAAGGKWPQSRDEVATLIGNFNRMAEELERSTVSKGRLDSVIEQMQEGLVIASPRGEIVHTNGAACRVLGYEKEELLGQSAALFNPRLVLLGAGPVEASQGGDSLPAPLLRKDGREVVVLLSTALLCDAAGQADGQLFLFREPTPR